MQLKMYAMIYYNNQYSKQAKIDTELIHSPKQMVWRNPVAPCI